MQNYTTEIEGIVNSYLDRNASDSEIIETVKTLTTGWPKNVFPEDEDNRLYIGVIFNLACNQRASTDVRAYCMEYVLNHTVNYGYQLVHKSFSSYDRTADTMEDLTSQIRTTIIELIPKYDCRYSPTTFIKKYILGACRQTINEKTGNTPYYAEKQKQIRYAINAIQGEGKVADTDSIYEYLKSQGKLVTRNVIANNLDMMDRMTPVYLDAEDTPEMAARIDTPEEAYMKKDLSSRINRLICDSLNPFEKKLLDYIDIVSDGAFKITEAARHFGCSVSDIKTTKGNILRKLTAAIRTGLYGDDLIQRYIPKVNEERDFEMINFSDEGAFAQAVADTFNSIEEINLDDQIIVTESERSYVFPDDNACIVRIDTRTHERTTI